MAKPKRAGRSGYSDAEDAVLRKTYIAKASSAQMSHELFVACGTHRNQKAIGQRMMRLRKEGLKTIPRGKRWVTMAAIAHYKKQWKETVEASNSTEIVDVSLVNPDGIKGAPAVDADKGAQPFAKGGNASSKTGRRGRRAKRAVAQSTDGAAAACVVAIAQLIAAAPDAASLVADVLEAAQREGLEMAQVSVAIRSMSELTQPA